MILKNHIESCRRVSLACMKQSFLTMTGNGSSCSSSKSPDAFFVRRAIL
jgi:hypothetical protein